MLDFPISNNKAEYEAPITRLKVAKDFNVKTNVIFCDSMLVVNQVNTSFETREPWMASYIQVVKDLISRFDSFKINHIPRVANSKSDKPA